MSNRPILLSPQETFQNYEKRNRPGSALSGNTTQSTVMIRPPISNSPHPQLACEYRTGGNPNDRLACEYRQAEPTVTAYFPETNKRKIPLSYIIGAAVGVPIFLIIVLFGAIWLQELGIL